MIPDRTFDYLEKGKIYRADPRGPRLLGKHRFAEVKLRGWGYNNGVPIVKLKGKLCRGNEMRVAVEVSKFNAWREPYLEQGYRCFECGEIVKLADRRRRIKHFCATTGTDTWLCRPPLP